MPDFEGGQAGDYLTDALTTSALEFLRHRDRQRPFLMCLAQYAVHTPIQAPAGLTAKYRAKRTARYPTTETPTLPAPFDSVSRARQDDPDYAAMLENLDTNLGRIFTALEELGLRDNTIVVFTSDNGGLCTLAQGKPGPTSNLPWRSGKGWNYEGGIRIPTFLAWPGHLPPGSISVPASTTDLYPTLLDLCGLPLRPQQHLDGRSLASILRGQPDPDLSKRTLAWYYPHDHGSGHRASAALRQGSWKLIHYLKSGTTELYNLAMDPGETTDLAAAQSERTRTMRTELLRWIEVTRK